MNRSSRSKGKNNYCSVHSSSTVRHRQVQELKTIMNNVRHLQQKVNNLPGLSQGKKIIRAPSTPKRPKKTTNSSSKYNSGSAKRTKRQQILLPGCGKLQLEPEFKSIVLTNNNTYQLKQQRQLSPFEVSPPQPEYIHNYMSLQFQNFKLQRNNLNLEKQLLEQSLMMERREKQLLKNKLKRIKTHHNYDQTEKNIKDIKITDQTQTPVISSFNTSPIRNKAQYLSVKGQENKYAILRKQFKKDTVKKHCLKIQDEIDSLLLSQQNESEIKISPQKTSQSMLEQQLWDLLKESGKQDKKGSTRQALGDIANRLKVVRKK